jgi:hypothetical protein
MKDKPFISVTEYHNWKTDPITVVLVHQLTKICKDEAVSVLSRVNPHKKTSDQIALEMAYQAGRQSVLTKLTNFEDLKETFLPERDVNWEK